MSTRTRITLVLGTILLLLAGACDRMQKTAWEERTPADLASDIDKRTVLFAPVAAGPIMEVHPEAPEKFAVDMARHVNTLIGDVHAWASVTLPPSDDPAWNQGVVGAARGAHLVILTEVLEVGEASVGALSSGSAVATVRMRAINAAGQEVWRKNELSGKVPLTASPKFMHAGSHPLSKAAWEASKKGILALNGWLTALGSPNPAVASGQPDPVVGPTIQVPITSIPEGADILIDGEFRGNTPATLALPRGEVQVRIQRAGYQPWERRIPVTPEMRLQPALMPVGAPADAAAPAMPDAAPPPAPAGQAQ